MSKEERKIQFDAQLDIVKTYEEEEKLYVEGYAATTDYDDQGDIITPEAIKQSENDLLERSTVLLNHDKDRPIGKVEEAKGDAKGLKIKVLISKAEPEIRQKIREGIINKFSIRGSILESTKEKVKQAGKEIWANIIKAMKLIEVSMVSLPANSEAKALAWYMSKALEDDAIKVKENNNEALLKKIEELNNVIKELKGYSVDMPMPVSQMYAYARHMKGMTDRKVNDKVTIHAKGSIKAINADENDCYYRIEIEDGELTEVAKSMADIKKKDGTLYTQEEIDSLHVTIEGTQKELADMKAASEVKEVETKKSMDEVSAKIVDSETKLAAVSKELEDAKKSNEVAMKELETIKAQQADDDINKKVDAKWSELEVKSYKKEDAAVIKSILKKGFLGQALTPDETDNLISKKIQGSILKLGFETAVHSGEITKERRAELISLGGIKIKTEKK